VSVPCPAIIDGTYYGRLPKVPPSPFERIESWRRKWVRLTIEETLANQARPTEKVVRLTVQR
jgi:hypothetical protein